METIILAAIAGLLFCIQLLYLFIIYNGIYRKHKKAQSNKLEYANELPSVSIIISAHNQGEYLQNNLPAILTQDYPNYEVIVINDDSTDETKEILTLLEQEHPHLYHSFTSQSARYISHKKLSLTLGIKAAKNDCLVFTEPYCCPKSNQWLRLMARNFTPDTDIVLGYSNYISNQKNRQRFISFDTLITAMRYMGYAVLGKPYMGVGYNMAYRKSLFLKNKGFASHLNLLRGEDQLFVNKYATATNTKIEIDANATVYIETFDDNRDWRDTKMNSIVNKKSFKSTQKFNFALESILIGLFYSVNIVGVVFCIIFKTWFILPLFLLLMLLYLFCQGTVINITAKALGDEQRYYLLIPLFDIIRPIRTLYLKLKLIFMNKKEYMRN